MILVTAAHGNQGRLLVPKLLAAGMSVRASVASESSAAKLRAAGVTDVVVGDPGDKRTVARAVRGVQKIYHVGPTIHPRERTISSGLEFTILQPANYMLPLKLLPVFERGVFELSWALERRQSMVDLGDVTDVAVEVLTHSASHTGATYELVGPGRYTAHELGGIISGVLGRQIGVREIDADTYLRAWVGGADPKEVTHQIRVLRSISARYSSHDFIGNPNVLTWLLGRPPTSFEEFVRRQYSAFPPGGTR